jgi:hypothetical protein
MKPTFSATFFIFSLWPHHHDGRDIPRLGDGAATRPGPESRPAQLHQALIRSNSQRIKIWPDPPRHSPCCVLVQLRAVSVRIVVCSNLQRLVSAPPRSSSGKIAIETVYCYQGRSVQLGGACIEPRNDAVRGRDGTGAGRRASAPHVQLEYSQRF